MFLNAVIESDSSSQNLSDEVKHEQTVRKFETKNLDKQKFARQTTIFRLDGTVNKVEQDITEAEIADYLLKT